MKRGVFDTLRRALDNTVANWPLIAIRFAETIVFGVIAVITAVAALVPILVSVGIHLAELRTPDDLSNAAFALMQKWGLLLWVFAAIAVMLVIFVAIHSFVEAGCARVYVDGDRVAGPAVDGPRSRYGVFSMQRWLAGAVDGWWTLFWIYNAAWSAAALILMIPLLPTMLLMIVLRERPPALIATGCVGLALTLMLFIVVGFVTGMWTSRAIAGWAVRRAGFRDALDAGWAALRTDFGRMLLIALAVVLVAIAGSAFFASFSMFAGLGQAMGKAAVYNVITMPIRFAGSILSSLFSAAVSSWSLAAFAALAVEDRN